MNVDCLLIMVRLLFCYKIIWDAWDFLMWRYFMGWFIWSCVIGLIIGGFGNWVFGWFGLFCYKRDLGFLVISIYQFPAYPYLYSYSYLYLYLAT